MKKATTLLVGSLALAALAGPALAITNDGFLDITYGLPKSVQVTQTQFGDANIGHQWWANGSELDVAYATIESGVLHLFLGGNLESNYNKLEIFFDTGAGGQNKLRGDNAGIDFGGLNRMGDDGSGNGLTFDVGFEPDYYITVTGGDVGGGTYGMFANYAELLTAGGGAGYYLGTNPGGTPGPMTGGTNPNNIEITLDNRNPGGVDGGCGVSVGAGVGSGIELAIPLAALGGSQCMNISVMINGSGHDFLSNQVLGWYAGCNLGEPRNVNFATHLGLQYFTVCDQSTVSRPSSWGQLKTTYR